MAASATHVSAPDAIGHRNFWTSYAWPEQGEEWSAPWGGSDAMWYGSLLPRLRHLLPARGGHVLEIGCGFGRVTEYLRRHAAKVTGVDVTPRCIEHAQRRFSGDARVTLSVNDGRSLDMVGEDSVDLVVSWETLHAVEQETVEAYLRDLSRKLAPGGRGFIHHSNLGVHTGEMAGIENDERAAGRRASQTAERFAQACAAHGLRCVSQEIVSFDETGLWSDAFSVIERDDRQADKLPRVVYAHDWPAERAIARRLASMYTRVAGTA